MPLKDFYTPNCAGLNIGHTSTNYSDSITKLEGFAHDIWGLAPLWACGESCEELDEICLRGIISGTDPESDEYWDELTEAGVEQRIVEMSPLGLALVLVYDKGWDPLTDKQKDNFHKWLLKANCDKLSDNNWHFFPVIVNLGLKNVDVWYDKDRIQKSIAKYHSLYRGNGWYHDTNRYQAVYYVSFAIHFYSLIYAKVMENEDSENSRIFKERAEEFAKNLCLLV